MRGMGSAIRLTVSAVGGLSLLVGLLVALDYALDANQGTEVRLLALLGLLAGGAVCLIAIRWTVLWAERDRPGSAQVGSGELAITAGFMLILGAGVVHDSGTPAAIALAAGFALYWIWRIRLGRAADSLASSREDGNPGSVEEVLDRLERLAEAVPIPLTGNQVRISRRRLERLTGELRVAAEAPSLSAEAQRRTVELAELLEVAPSIPLTADVRIDSEALVEQIAISRAELGVPPEAASADRVGPR